MCLVKSLFLCLHEIIYNLFGYNFRVLEKKEEEGRHEKEYVSLTFNWFSQMPLYDWIAGVYMEILLWLLKSLESKDFRLFQAFGAISNEMVIKNFHL